MSHILLVEDSPEMQLMIKTILSDHEVVVCSSIKEAEQYIKRMSFDLALLDLNLPDGIAFSLCAEIRGESKSKNMPVMFLTGDARDVSALMGYSVGADDYIIKPIKPRLFRAKILNWLKRAQESESEQIVFFNDFEIHPSLLAVILKGNGEPVRVVLTPIEFKIFWRLTKKSNQIQSRDQLIADAWGPTTFITHRVVDQHVCFLRKKLGPIGDQIKSVYGSGYVFNPQCQVQNSEKKTFPEHFL